MGGRNSCQGKWCREPPYGICECRSMMLCAACFDRHKSANPKTVHKFVPIREPVEETDEEKPITWKSLILVKRIYVSPEGNTEVHEAMIKDRPGKYAVKVMMCKGEAELRKKQKESALQLSLKHQNICVCKAAFLDESYSAQYRFVIVMEFSENGDLEEEIDKRKLKRSPWGESDLMSHILQLVDAFAYLQENNLTHGDIKPKNLYLASDGRIKIGDFGESKKSMKALVTRTYQVTGTVVYFSPLLFSAYLDIITGKNNSGDVRHNPIKSDVFSLGLSLLHMATLTKPLELNNLEIGENDLQMKIQKVVSRLGYSANVKDVISLMLQVSESRRPDFMQLKVYLSPKPVMEPVISESPMRHMRSYSMKLANYQVISISQTQGKALLYDGISKTISINNNKIQASSRAFLLKDAAIITGGLKNSTAVYKINLVTGSANKLNDLNIGRSWHAVAVSAKNILLIGGRGDNKEPLNSIESLKLEESHDLISVNWDIGSQLVHARENATAVFVEANVFVFGGSSKRNNKWELLESIERFENGRWEVLEVVLAKPTAAVAAVYIEEGKVLISGGIRDKGAHTNESYELDAWRLSLRPVPEYNLLEADFFAGHCSGKVFDRIFIMGSLIGCHLISSGRTQWELNRY